MIRATCAIGLTLLCLAGCGSAELQNEFSAVRVDPGPAANAELQNVVSSALDGRPVTLAANALTEESTLIIEPAKLRRIEGPPELGRNLGRPAHFRLVLDGNHCFLVHGETGLRWLLGDTRCVAE